MSAKFHADDLINLKSNWKQRTKQIPPPPPPPPF